MPKTKRRKQFAALPFQAGAEGVEVLLVTSRDTGRWVIPKGWPMKNRRPHRAAAIEAYEEAGVVGKADKTALGTYDYDKRIETGAIPCRVTVFPLKVAQLLDEWPEGAERRRTDDIPGVCLREQGLVTSRHVRLLRPRRPEHRTKTRQTGEPRCEERREAAARGPDSGRRASERILGANCTLVSCMCVCT